MKIKNFNKSSRKLHLGVFVGYVSIFIFVVLTIFLTIQTSLTGSKLARLEKEEEAYKRQKQEYISDFAKKSSVTAISLEAENMGYIKPSNIVYLTDNTAIAKLP